MKVFNNKCMEVFVMFWLEIYVARTLAAARDKQIDVLYKVKAFWQLINKSVSVLERDHTTLTGDITVLMSETHSEIQKGLKTIICRLPTPFANYIYILFF